MPTAFSQDARTVVVNARLRAVACGEAHVLPEHLLAGMCKTVSGALLLEQVGLDVGGLRRTLDDVASARLRGGFTSSDASALATLGIDLDEVLDRMAETGFDDAASRAPAHKRRTRGGPRLAGETADILRWAFRVTAQERRQRVDEGDLLLAVVSGDGLVADALARQGITSYGVRASVVRWRSVAAQAG